jgi:hypothetical protein
MAREERFVHRRGTARAGSARWALLVMVFGLLAGCGTATPGGSGDAASPSPPPPPTAARAVAGFPDASNTGVPPGTELSDYTGPCLITAKGTVIDSKTVNCNLAVMAADVMISRSKINGQVVLDTDRPAAKDWSMTLQDSEVDAGVVQLAAVSTGNMTVLRSNIHGGQTSVQCGELATYCIVRDSWLHGQQIPDGADWHLGGFLSNGGRNVELTHNRVICEPMPTGRDGGCTGDINLLGDFAPVSHVKITRNLLEASLGNSYCTYGGDAASKKFPHADNVVYRDNVFERGTNGQCGNYGPVSSFNSQGPGNVWENNRWDDGGLVTPAD